MKKNNCIIFEGLDGAGKSTIISKLNQTFKNKFIIKTEPCHGQCIVGKFLRNIILKKKIKLSDESRMLLFAACRCEHMQNLEIDNSKIFLYDRSFFSTFVYNTKDYFMFNLFSWIKEDFEKKFNILNIFFLNITPNTSLKRKDDIYNFQELTRFYDRYQYIFNNKKILSKLITIQAERNVTQVYEEIKKHIIKFIK